MWRPQQLLWLAALVVPASSFTAPSIARPVVRGRTVRASAATPNPEHDILLRVARGEKADRTPVWLMRQVGAGGVDR